jgi:hypothetical protein
MLLLVFTFSMFASATLLFLVEPMIAKMLLPTLGGTPAVWNTCMVFFQMMLLAGYLYAYVAMRWLGRRAQIVVHLSLVSLPLFLSVLPLHLPRGWEPPTQSSPVFWLLGVLFVSVGLPFFVLSSSTPVLQGGSATPIIGRPPTPTFCTRPATSAAWRGCWPIPSCWSRCCA